MLSNPATKVFGEADIEDFAIERGQHIAARFVRDEPFAALAKDIASLDRRRKLAHVHSSMSPSAEEACNALVISCEITLMAPALRKLALPPLAQKSA